MLSTLARWLLTATSVAPVLLAFAILFGLEGNWATGIVFLVICLLLVMLCVVMIRKARSQLEDIDFQVSSIEAADRENVSFLVIYILPLFTANLSELNWSIWIPVIAIFGWITATGYSYHFNPLLNLLGWHFYRVHTSEGVTYVLLTKKELRTANTKLVVGQLTEYIVLDKEK